ncbi:MAG: hypothetical protein ACRCXZ_08310, partial [Patescibacteria group bacterium]
MNKNNTNIPDEQLRILHNILAYYPTVQTVKIVSTQSKANSVLELIIIGDGQDQIPSILADIGDSEFVLRVKIVAYAETQP